MLVAIDGDACFEGASLSASSCIADSRTTGYSCDNHKRRCSLFNYLTS